ncbi:MAG: hypothetical protein M3O46_13755, partial [Myxococcota bacterium]|nr:hypothetical protein [Myxococcota bacterium]
MKLRIAIAAFAAIYCAVGAGCAGHSTESETEVLGSQSEAVTAYGSYFYLQCNATDWTTDVTSRIQPTSDAKIFRISYDITQNWMLGPSGQDQCQVVNTVGLDTTSKGATWYGRQGGPGVVSVPAPMALAVTLASPKGSFGVRYASLGKYQATLNIAQNPPTITFTQLTQTPPANSMGAYYYLQCNATDWNTDNVSRMLPTAKPSVYSIQYNVTQNWMLGPSGEDQCQVVNTIALNSTASGATWLGRQGGWGVVPVPGAVNLSAATGDFAVRYPKLGAYQATLDVSHTPATLTFGSTSGALCPPGALDSDGDGLCDAAEAFYGTDPHNPDTDGDAINDGHEVLGTADLNLPSFGANARHRDIFVYMNYYVAPFAAAITQVTQAFAAAPVSNVDGVNGINIHFIDGGQIAGADQVQNIVGPLSGDWSQVDTIKTKYLPTRWANYAHYLLVGYQYDGGSSSGISRGIPAHDYLVTLGLWFPTYGTQLEQAGTIMHELGHNLGLQHGGYDGINYKANYLSIMSYRYQVVGLYKDGTDGVLDYSRLQLAALVEASMSEPSGMPPTGSTTTADTSHYGAKLCPGLVRGTLNGPFDFNNDGTFESGLEAVDLDCDGATTSTIEASWNDWPNLTYSGAAGGGGVIGPGASSTGRPLTVAAARTLQTVTPDKMDR